MPRSVTPACDSEVRMPKNFSFGLTRFTITSDCGSKPSIMVLTQFNEHAIAGRRMEEGDAAAVRARHRRLVDEAIAALLEAGEVRFDVVDAEADVVDAFTALFDELGDRRVCAARLEQFEVGISNRQERSADFLRLDRLDVLDFQPEVLVDFLRRVERLYSNADVVELRHTPRASAPQMCLCSCVCSRAGTWSASIHSASDFMSISPQTGEKSTVQRPRLRSSTTRRAQS